MGDMICAVFAVTVLSNTFATLPSLSANTKKQRIAYHHLIEGDPAVRWKVLQHGNKELETAIPVAEQQHHSNQVEYSHHGTGQVIGHVEDLSGGEEMGRTEGYRRGEEKRRGQMCEENDKSVDSD